MKKLRVLAIPVLFALLLAAGTSSVKADLNAMQVATQINALNNGKGIVATYSSNSLAGSEGILTFDNGYTAVSTSAYGGQAAGANYFKSFCIEPAVYVDHGEKLSMTLNYANGKSVTSSGLALTLGVAKLYKDFATASLGNYDYTNASGQLSNNALQLGTALRVLLGAESIASWAQNIYLSQLLAINNQQSYWKAVYDPGKLYSEIGEYSVFALNVNNFTTNVDRQDHLILVKTTSTVPEPASVLLWGLGSLSALGISFARKRKLKKLCLR